VGCSGVKQVHPIPHDQAGSCLMMGRLPLHDSFSIAQCILYLVYSFLHFTLQICNSALYPAEEEGWHESSGVIKSKRNAAGLFADNLTARQCCADESKALKLDIGNLLSGGLTYG